MEYLNERPIVADDDKNKVLKTELNPRLFKSRKHSTNSKMTRELNVLHRAMSKGKPKVKLKQAERVLRNRASRNQSGVDWGGSTKHDHDMLVVKETYNPLDPGDGNEKPLEPKAPQDPVMKAFRKRRQDRLQRATHGNAPPILPDNMDAEMNEVSKEDLFPKIKTVAKLSQGLSPAQNSIWANAMNKKSSAREEWRRPSQARRLAKRLADSVLYEAEGERRDHERRAGGTRRRGGSSGSPSLIKAPRYGERGASKQVRTTQGVGTLTGSDSYRPKATHATLVKHQPKRMLEKLRGLIASWRTKQGAARQVVKNIPIKANFGTSRLKKLNAPKKETDLKRNKR